MMGFSWVAIRTSIKLYTFAGVSQPYISKLLNGNHRELSLRCRKNIYSWYLNCRRHPEKLCKSHSFSYCMLYLKMSSYRIFPCHHKSTERLMAASVFFMVVGDSYASNLHPFCSNHKEDWEYLRKFSISIPWWSMVWMNILMIEKRWFNGHTESHGGD